MTLNFPINPRNTHCDIRRRIPWTVWAKGTDRAGHEDSQFVLLGQLDDVVQTLDVHSKYRRLEGSGRDDERFSDDDDVDDDGGRETTHRT